MAMKQTQKKPPQQPTPEQVSVSRNEGTLSGNVTKLTGHRTTTTTPTTTTPNMEKEKDALLTIGPCC